MLKTASPAAGHDFDPQAPIADYVHGDWPPLRAGQTTAEALETLRQVRLPEKIVYFYVADEDGRLVGVLPTRRLLAASPEVRLEALMVRHVVALPDTATLADASEAFLRHRFLALPVADADGRLVGVVDIGVFAEDFVGPLDGQSWDRVFQLIGVHVSAGRRSSPWAGFRERFPWLLANISGGLVCALLAGRFETLLDAALVLALFVPVVLALAESVSIQSTTITLASLGPSPSARRPGLGAALGREFATATLLGLASGGLVGGAAWLWKGDARAALVIGASIALAIVTACLIGVLLPWGVRLLGRDPKLASGPLVLASADVATLLFYFNIAERLLA